MQIGKIIRSNAHTDYVSQVYGPGEMETLPAPEDYAFGTFVRMPLGAERGYLIGVIYDTVLLNPDFGNLGPRLSPQPDLAIFSPDYLAEKVTLVGITAVGQVAADGTVAQGVPALAAQIDAMVERMEDAAVQAFHSGSGGAGVELGYVPLLLSHESPLATRLLIRVVERLRGLFPEATIHLDVLKHELSWRAIIGPMGGGR